MRFQNLVAFGLVAAVLAGCVAPLPVTGPVTTAPGTAIPTTPTVLDEASRAIARNVVNSEMQKRLPGANVAPYTDCVVNNATTAELIDIAQASRAGSTGMADSVAAIVSRPATSQCIAGAARATA